MARESSEFSTAAVGCSRLGKLSHFSRDGHQREFDAAASLEAFEGFDIVGVRARSNPGRGSPESCMPTHVLIIENDAPFAAELADALRSLGAQATVVEDPSQGLQLALSERPNLIVLTVELHKMNGFSVCNRIKKIRTWPTFPSY
ncbi:MAG: response regulator [Polyangiaceae bacterium]